jgi:hypothetical protein
LIFFYVVERQDRKTLMPVVFQAFAIFSLISNHQHLVPLTPVSKMSLISITIRKHFKFELFSRSLKTSQQLTTSDKSTIWKEDLSKKNRKLWFVVVIFFIFFSIHNLDVILLTLTNSPEMYKKTFIWRKNMKDCDHRAEWGRQKKTT